jgi:hypothetical protein
MIIEYINNIRIAASPLRVIDRAVAILHSTSPVNHFLNASSAILDSINDVLLRYMIAIADVLTNYNFFFLG